MRPKLQRTINFDETQAGMIQLGPEGGQPQFCCTKLPRHWRSNKSLAAQFRVIAYDPIPDNTKCSLLAGNDENHSAQLKNNIAYFHNNVAEFSDLRFVGKSGRGKLFNVTVTVWTDPVQVLVYRHAIKVTADGPRPPRPKPGMSSMTDQSNASSDSGTEADSQDYHSNLVGVEKNKAHKSKAMKMPTSHIDLSALGLVASESKVMERPSSCHSNNSSTFSTTTTTASLQSLPATPLQFLAAVVASQLMQSQASQALMGQGDPTPRPASASFGHKPWLKQSSEKPLWRPYVEDSH